jgi:hypothetical protein
MRPRRPFLLRSQNFAYYPQAVCKLVGDECEGTHIGGFCNGLVAIACVGNVRAR